MNASLETDTHMWKTRVRGFIILFVFLIAGWSVFAITNHPEVGVTLFSTFWFSACVIGGYIFPPCHSAPTDQMRVSQHGSSDLLYVTSVPFCSTVRIVYTLITFAQTQSAAFVLGSLIYGMSRINNEDHDGDDKSIVASSMLALATVIAVVGMCLGALVEYGVLIAQLFTLFVPFSFIQRTDGEVHIAIGRLVVSLVATLAVAGAMIAKRAMYMRAVVMSATCASGALIFMSTSWDNMIDPGSSGPYTIVAAELALWCVASLIIIASSSVTAMTLTAAIAMTFSVLMGVLDTHSAFARLHTSMHTWAATATLAAIFGVTLLIYDNIQYPNILRAYVQRQTRLSSRWERTPSGMYLTALSKTFVMPDTTG